MHELAVLRENVFFGCYLIYDCVTTSACVRVVAIATVQEVC